MPTIATPPIAIVVKLNSGFDIAGVAELSLDFKIKNRGVILTMET